MIVAEGAPQRPRRARARRRPRSRSCRPPGVALASCPAARRRRVGDDGRARLRTQLPTRVLAELCGWAAERGIELERLEVTRPTLEDVYLELVREPAAEAERGGGAGVVSTLRVQLRSDLKVFVRNPAALFFTAILPVIFLCLFVSIFGNERDEEYGNIRVVDAAGAGVHRARGVSASFVGLAIGLVSVREDGVLKRIRGTPVPPWIVFAGRIGTAIVMATIVTVVLMRDRRDRVRRDVPTSTLPGLVVALVVGASAFCALGIAYTTRDPQRGRRARDDERRRAAAVLHLRRLRARPAELPDGLRTSPTCCRSSRSSTR